MALGSLGAMELLRRIRDGGAEHSQTLKNFESHRHAAQISGEVQLRSATLLAVASSGTPSSETSLGTFATATEKRFLRHFLMLGWTWAVENVVEVYSTILSARLSSKLSTLGKVHGKALLEVYEFARTAFKRSPKAPYLTWTLRDVARALAGILAAAADDTSPDTLRAAFHHEVDRVFKDKLKTSIHKELLQQHLQTKPLASLEASATGEGTPMRAPVRAFSCKKTESLL